MLSIAHIITGAIVFSIINNLGWKNGIRLNHIGAELSRVFKGRLYDLNVTTTTAVRNVNMDPNKKNHRCCQFSI